MSELEKLMKQKKEIEDKIKALKNTEKTCGKIRISKKRFASGRPDEWALHIYRQVDSGIDRRLQWMPVIVSQSKVKVVSMIPGLIEDLQKMYDMMLSEEADKEE